MVENNRNEARARREAQRSSRIRELGNEIVTQNTRAMVVLNQSVIAYGNATNRLVGAFDKIDKFQVKSLAMGTTMNKFIGENINVLNKLRGDFFMNAEELLKNFGSGIRENSDSFLELQNIMKNTGQDTDGLRAVMSNLLFVQQNDITAIDKLAKINKKVGEDSLISNDRLIEVVNNLGIQMKQASLTRGGPANVAAFATEIAGALQGIGFEEIPKIMSLLVGPDGLSQRIFLGLQQVNEGILQGNMTLQDAKPFILQGYQRLNSILGESKASNANTIRNRVLQKLQGSQDLVAFRNFGSKLQNQIEVSEDLKKSSEDNFKNRKTVEEEALNFYSKTFKDYYKDVIKWLPRIVQASIGSNAGLMVGGFGGRMIGGVFGKAAAGAMVGGPFGMVIGGALGAILPGLMGLNKSAMEQRDDLLKAQEDTKRAIEDQNKKPEPKRRFGSAAEMMAQRLLARRTEEQKEFLKNTMHQERLLKAIEELNSKVKNRGSLVPSKETKEI